MTDRVIRHDLAGAAEFVVADVGLQTAAEHDNLERHCLGVSEAAVDRRSSVCDSSGAPVGQRRGPQEVVKLPASSSSREQPHVQPGRGGLLGIAPLIRNALKPGSLSFELVGNLE
jgi:hypothetical protein